MSTPNQPTTPYPQGGAPQQPAYGQAGGQYPTAPQQPAAQQPAAQQPAYAQGAYAQGQQQYRPQAPVAASTATTLGQTNTFAFLAIIFAFLSPIAGIVFGHMGLSQIKRNGDAGRGIALTGLIISYAYFALIIIFIFLYVGMLAMIFGSMGAAMSSLDSY